MSRVSACARSRQFRIPGASNQVSDDVIIMKFPINKSPPPRGGGLGWGAFGEASETTVSINRVKGLDPPPYPPPQGGGDQKFGHRGVPSAGPSKKHEFTPSLLIHVSNRCFRQPRARLLPELSAGACRLGRRPRPPEDPGTFSKDIRVFTLYHLFIRCTTWNSFARSLTSPPSAENRFKMQNFTAFSIGIPAPTCSPAARSERVETGPMNSPSPISSRWRTATATSRAAARSLRPGQRLIKVLIPAPGWKVDRDHDREAIRQSLVERLRAGVLHAKIRCREKVTPSALRTTACPLGFIKGQVSLSIQ